jgi:hypothetical protein
MNSVTGCIFTLLAVSIVFQTRLFAEHGICSRATVSKFDVVALRCEMCACRKPPPRSCDQAIFVDQATDARMSSDAVLLKIDRVGQRLQRRGAVQRAVRPMLVMVSLVLAQDPRRWCWFQTRVRSSSSRRHPPDPAFGDRVHPGRPDVAQHGPDPGAGEDRVECGGEVRAAVARRQRRIVSGVSSRNPWRRPFGITPSSAASRARSAQVSFGRRGCRRCRTASWWRRIKISAVFHASSRRDSRSHAANRVANRNTNRGHMNRDHDGRSAGRATLLVRAVDAILGTHRSEAGHAVADLFRGDPAESEHHNGTEPVPARRRRSSRFLP